MHARAYIGAIDELRDEDQRELCRESAKLLGVSPRALKFYGPGEWDDFLKDLRPNEVAIVASLLIVKEVARSKRGQVGRRFERAVREIERRAAFIYDSRGELEDEDAVGIRSTDEVWLDRVDHIHGKVTHARKLDKAKASEMGKISAAVAPGIVAQFRSRKRAPDRRRVKVLWTSAAFDNVGEALEAIGEEFPELDGASESTIRLLTGVGRNGKMTPTERRRRSTT